MIISEHILTKHSRADIRWCNLATLNPPQHSTNFFVPGQNHHLIYRCKPRNPQNRVSAEHGLQNDISMSNSKQLTVPGLLYDIKSDCSQGFARYKGTGTPLISSALEIIPTRGKNTVIVNQSSGGHFPIVAFSHQSNHIHSPEGEAPRPFPRPRASTCDQS